jgi:hypothetical protein
VGDRAGETAAIPGGLNVRVSGMGMCGAHLSKLVAAVA